MKVWFFAISLLLLSWKNLFAADVIPVCQRPTDFSDFKLVSGYEDCIKRRASFCEHHEKIKECQKTKKDLGIKEPDPAERCSIQRDGSYRCQQDPIRFISPEEPSAPAAGSAPSVSTIPTEENPPGSPAPSPTAPGASTPAPTK
jgi:hypothetical protein